MNPVADSDRLHVLHMLECIQLVSEYTRLDRGTFFGSRMVQDTCAISKPWRNRASERVIGSTTGMYGALQGIIGQSLAAIPALELEGIPLLEERE